MKVNFIDEFRLIMRRSKDEGLSLRERALWVALFYIANDRASWDMYSESYEWPSGYFSVNTAELSLYSSLDKRGIETTRKSLQERGILDFIAGEKNARVPQYKLHYLSICAGHKVVPNDYFSARREDLHADIWDVDGDADCAEGAQEDDFSALECENLNKNCPNIDPNHDPNSVPNDVPNSVPKDAPKDAPIILNINKEKDKEKDNKIHPSIQTLEQTPREDGWKDSTDEIAREKARIVIENNLGYEDLLEERPEDAHELWEIKELIVDAVCSKKKTMRVAGEEKPAEIVRNQLLKLNGDHIRFVLDSLGKTTSEIRDVKGYLLTALYNASLTFWNALNAEWRRKENEE